jgi:hypothetical protein
MPRDPDHTIVITSAGLRALHQSRMSKVEHTALWELVVSLPTAGALVSQADVAIRISSSYTHVHKAIKKLCLLGFLLRGEKEGVSYRYQINPAFLRVLSGS